MKTIKASVNGTCGQGIPHHKTSKKVRAWRPLAKALEMALVRMAADNEMASRIDALNDTLREKERQLEDAEKANEVLRKSLRQSNVWGRCAGEP